MLLTKKYRIVIKTLPVSHRTDTLHTRAFCSIQTLSSRRSLCATATHHLAHAAHSRRPCNHFASCPGSHNVRNLLIRFRRRGSEEDASVTCRNTGGTLHCPHGAYGQKPHARTLNKGITVQGVSTPAVGKLVGSPLTVNPLEPGPRAQCTSGRQQAGALSPRRQGGGGPPRARRQNRTRARAATGVHVAGHVVGLGVLKVCHKLLRRDQPE